MELVLLLLVVVLLTRLPKKNRPKEGGFLIGLRVLTVILIGVFIVMLYQAS